MNAPAGCVGGGGALGLWEAAKAGALSGEGRIRTSDAGSTGAASLQGWCVKLLCHLSGTREGVLVIRKHRPMH